MATRNVHIKIVDPPTGTAAGGTVRFRLPYALHDSTDDTTLAPGDYTATLVAGEATIALPVNDEAGVTPTGWSYEVAVRTSSWATDGYLAVPTGGSTLEFADIFPGATVTTVNTYATAGALAAEEVARVAVSVRDLASTKGLAPIAFTKPSGPLIHAADTSLSSVYWPWVLRVDDVLGAPLGTYYMWISTNHGGASGRIGLLYANNPLGPWTWYGVVYQDTTSGSETETPSVVWNPSTSLFHMYYQQLGPSGLPSSQSQATLLATSPDGVTWTRIGVVAIVEDDVTVSGHSGYWRPWRVGGKWHAHSLLRGGNQPRFGLWHSPDGLSWTVDYRPIGYGSEWVAGNKIVAMNSGSVMEIYGRLWWIGQRTDFNSGGTHTGSTYVMAPLASSLRALGGPAVTVIDVDQGWESDDMGAGGSVLVDGGLIYLYYTSGSPLAIGVAVGVPS
jgi:hypothetical protein